MSFFDTLDAFGKPCNACQAYQDGKDPCAKAPCPPGFEKVSNKLIDGSQFYHCAPIVKGKPTCRGYYTPDEAKIKEARDTERFMKIGIGVAIGLILIRQWQTS